MTNVSVRANGFNGQLDLFTSRTAGAKRHRSTPPEAWLHDRFGISYLRARLLAEHAGLGLRHDR
jgi:hypothetical protein